MASNSKDPIPSFPESYDANGNVRTRRLRLDPDLGDGYHWTLHDVPDEILMDMIRSWMSEAWGTGDSITLEIVEMSDQEADELPEI